MTRYELSGKVVLVTGGARGIGFATARSLAARGARPVVVDLDSQSVERAAAQLGADALGVAADVTDRGAMQRAVAAAVDRFGGVDVIVANAGIVSRVATFRAMSSETLERVLEVNTLGVCRSVDAALAQIIARRGHVVVVSSVYAFLVGAGLVPYAMSKAAVEQLGRALRLELSQHGASASVAYFGFIDTEMVHRALDADPLADQMFEAFPRPLRKRLPASAAAEAIVRGIEDRRARIILPRRWRLLFALRGVLGPLTEARIERDARTQQTLKQLDARAGQDQPTTA